MNGLKTMASLAVSFPIILIANARIRAADDCCVPLASADSPVRYFDGSSFAFTAPCFSYSCYPPNSGSFSTFSTSYYTPGYYSRSYAAKMIPPDFSPRLSNPWPYFYTPAGDYTPGYYSYYYTPGYFRY